MKIWKELSLMDFLPWGGAQQVYHYIDEQGKLPELEEMLTELYPEGVSETLINDILWFESEWVYEELEIPDPYAEDE